jgi:hypothetical protein
MIARLEPARILRSAAALVLWAAILACGVSLPAEEAPRPGDRFSDLRLRLTVYADAAGRDWLSAEGFDVSGYGLAEGWVEVITDGRGAARIRERGLRAEILEAREGPQPLDQGSLGPGARAIRTPWRRRTSFGRRIRIIRTSRGWYASGPRERAAPSGRS